MPHRRAEKAVQLGVRTDRAKAELVEHPLQADLARRDAVAGVRPARAETVRQQPRRRPGRPHRHEHARPAALRGGQIQQRQRILQAARADRQLHALGAGREHGALAGRQVARHAIEVVGRQQDVPAAPRADQVVGSRPAIRCPRTPRPAPARAPGSAAAPPPHPGSGRLPTPAGRSPPPAGGGRRAPRRHRGCGHGPDATRSSPRHARRHAAHAVCSSSHPVTVAHNLAVIRLAANKKAPSTVAAEEAC